RSLWPPHINAAGDVFAAGAGFPAAESAAASGERYGDQSAGGVYRRCAGGHAGRTGTGDAGRDVPDPRALHRAGAGLFALQRAVFRLRG
ncbi:hydroxypyruvate reductase, partial [Corchorus olitorius]